jgi:hypothetical protein
MLNDENASTEAIILISKHHHQTFLKNKLKSEKRLMQENKANNGKYWYGLL